MYLHILARKRLRRPGRPRGLGLRLHELHPHSFQLFLQRPAADRRLLARRFHPHQVSAVLCGLYLHEVCLRERQLQLQVVAHQLLLLRLDLLLLRLNCVLLVPVSGGLEQAVRSVGLVLLHGGTARGFALLQLGLYGLDLRFQVVAGEPVGRLDGWASSQLGRGTIRLRGPTRLLLDAVEAAELRERASHVGYELALRRKGALADLGQIAERPAQLSSQRAAVVAAAEATLAQRLRPRLELPDGRERAVQQAHRRVHRSPIVVRRLRALGHLHGQHGHRGAVRIAIDATQRRAGRQHGPLLRPAPEVEAEAAERDAHIVSSPMGSQWAMGAALATAAAGQGPA